MPGICYNIHGLDDCRSVCNGRTTLTPASLRKTEARSQQPAIRCVGTKPGHRPFQQRFRSRPGRSCLADVQGVVVAMEGQIRGEQVPLRFDPTLAYVVSLAEGFLLHAPLDAGLRQFGLPGVDFFDSTASIRSFAGELADKHPGSTYCHAAAEILLQRFVGQFFQFDDGA